jgi:large subunit ribosomal protein L22
MVIPPTARPSAPACRAHLARRVLRLKGQRRQLRQAPLRQAVHLDAGRQPMSKKKRERALSDSEAKAVARMLRVSPQKLNLLAQLIRGKKVSTALADLEFSRKRIARDVRKCLESAIANAENNHDLDVDDLVVAEAHVGKALVIKRHAARARGRVGAIFKPFANLTIVVREVETQA